MKTPESIKFLINMTTSHPKLFQYLLKSEATQGLTPRVGDLFAQGLIVPCTSSHNRPILPVQKGMAICPELELLTTQLFSISQLIQTQNSFVLSPTGLKMVHVMDLCSVFLASPQTSTSNTYLPLPGTINNIAGQPYLNGSPKALFIFLKYSTLI